MRRIHAVFPDSQELAVAWDHADHPDPLRRIESLWLLDSRGELPSPVFFEATDGVLSSTKGLELFKRSASFCNCPRRRIVFPAQGRSGLVSRYPQPRLITIGCDFNSQPVPAYDMQAVIMPYGGGTVDTALVMLTVNASGILVEQHPFMPDVRIDPSIWISDSGVNGQATYRPAEFIVSLETLASAIERSGELQILQRYPDLPDVLGQFGGSPLCALRQIEVSRDTATVKVTLEIDATVTVLTMLDDEDKQPHHCQTM